MLMSWEASGSDLLPNDLTVVIKEKAIIEAGFILI